MMYSNFWNGALPFGIVGFGILGILALVFTVAIIALKGYALWHAAKRNEVPWFIALLVLNTVGILELIYLYFIVKKWNKPHHVHHEHTHDHHTHS
jgi:hypothetical protein